MRRLTAVALLLLLLTAAPASLAQERGYAGPAELKGLRRVYVEAGSNRKNRERIVNELRKSRAGIEVVDAPERAELILLFAAEKVVTDVGVAMPQDDRTPYDQTDPPEIIKEDIDHGFGSAYIPAADGGRRVLFIWEGRKGAFTSAAGKFAGAFVKEYRKANGLK